MSITLRKDLFLDIPYVYHISEGFISRHRYVFHITEQFISRHRLSVH